MYIEQLIANMQEHKYLYVLESKVKLGWYLIDYGFDYDAALQLFEGEIPTTRSDSAAIWFPDRKIAVKFNTEEHVEEFRTFLDRPCSIVRVELEEILRKL